MRRRARPTWRAQFVALAALVGCSSGGAPAVSRPSSPVTRHSSSPAASSPSAAPPAAGTGWFGYHGDQARTGAVRGPAGVHARVRWRRRLGGDVQGQPVAAGDRIFAATERNRVVALDRATGRVVWSRTLGPPLTDVAARAGCGNIDPLGVTSTPVIDPARKVLYVVAEIASGAVRHELFGLSLATGAIERHLDVDPPLPTGESPAHLLQRASLALSNGRVYIPYGGNYGDCGAYHGWVVGVRTTGAARRAAFEVADDGEGGAIWQGGGAPAVDAAGNLYVTTGNANPDPPEGGPDPKHYTESVVKLSPALRPLASFKDRVAGGDEDLSTTNPVLLPHGRVFAIGKTDIAFVLRRSDLRPVASIRGVCGSDPDGGPAYAAAGNVVFVPCRGGGIDVLDLSSRTVTGRLADANSSPTLVGARLWAGSYSGGSALYVYDVNSHRLVHTVDVGATLPTFATPMVAGRLVVIGTTEGVVAVR